MRNSIVTDDLIDEFRDRGVTVLRGAFDAAWIGRLRDGLARNTAEPGPYRRNYGEAADADAFFGDYCNWRRIPEFETFVRESPAADIAGALMGSAKVNFFHEHALVKAPGTDAPTPWHHDQPYYCLSGEQTCSLWVPLDPGGRDSALEFVAGSHRWDSLFQPKMFVGEDYPIADDGFEPMPDIDAARADYDIVSHAVEPGDCVAFHFRTVHGAPGNRSADTWRRAIAFRWTGDDVRFRPRSGVMSPPFPEFPEFDLADGDALDSELVPVIRRRS